jgi:hypothetical protein
MHDLPSGPALLAAARAVLLDELMPLLPAARRFDALLIGNCLAIAEREATASTGPAEANTGELEVLYGAEGPSPVDGRDARRPRSSDAGTHELWRRFARDLRRGAFETSQPRDRRARALLWRLTIAKLRFSNPKFIYANGLAADGPVEPGGVGD